MTAAELAAVLTAAASLLAAIAAVVRSWQTQRQLQDHVAARRRAVARAARQVDEGWTLDE